MNNIHMYVIRASTGLYFKWNGTNTDWRGQWVSIDHATKYPIRSRKQLQAVQTMFPELILMWVKA